MVLAVAAFQDVEILSLACRIELLVIEARYKWC
jgi:hypothetical protein